MEIIILLTIFTFNFYTIYNYKIGSKHNLIDIFIKSLINTVFSNSCIMLICYYILKYQYLYFTILFSLKYIVLGLLISIILLFLEKNVKITNQKNNYKCKKIPIILVILTIELTLILLLSAIYIHSYYNEATFEQLLYHMTTTLDGTSSSIFLGAIKFIMPYFIKSTILVLLLFVPTRLTNRRITIRFKDKQINFIISRIMSILKYVVAICFFAFTLIYIINAFSIIDYIILSHEQTTLFEDEYVSAHDITLSFPQEKKNLIYIYMESMESTDISSDNGGYRSESLISELEQLALKYTNFSQNNKIGGATQLYGVGWTIAGMVAQTSGLPLKFASNIDKNSLDDYQSFLDGAYTLGEILEDNDYHNVLLLGSNAAFAGRAAYFTKHGNYEIMDFEYMKENGILSEDYDIDWWGYEDKKLYEYAKEKLEELAANDEPFNLTMLTVDTHPDTGYLDETCKVDSNLTHYENTIACASTMVYEFISWIQKQDFYENTVIIISGDHLVQGIHDTLDLEDLDRTVYNLFINSSITTDNSKNRLFSTMDLFPTTLAAMGVEIEGNRLGLGTNLFSNEKTLLEKYGYDYLNTELQKYSSYYINCLYNNKKC